MKVNIQHSIELDEIPDKVKEFLQGAAAKNADIVHDMDDVVSCMEGSFSIEKVLEQIDKIRHELANMDHTMLDCTEILHGYQKTLVQLRERPDDGHLAGNGAEVMARPSPEGYADQLKNMRDTMESLKPTNQLDVSEQSKFIREQFDEHVKLMKEGNHDNETRNEET